MYQIFPDHVKRVSDGKTFGFTPGDSDFDEYMVWIKQGNHPLPRDPDTPKQLALAQIDQKEREVQAPRFVRESLIAVAEFMATSQAQELGVTPEQALTALRTKNPGYIKLKALDDQIASIRALAK